MRFKIKDSDGTGGSGFDWNGKLLWLTTDSSEKDFWSGSTPRTNTISAPSGYSDISSFDTLSDGWETVTWDLSTHTQWNDRIITALRFELFKATDNNGEMRIDTDIDYIKIFAKTEQQKELIMSNDEEETDENLPTEQQLELLPPETEPPLESVDRHEHQDEDYEYVRNNLQEIIETGSTALQGIVELAESSDHPRAYEVVGQIMRQLAETNKDLIDLQKDMKKIKNEESAKKVTQNAIFMGSTAELQKFLRGQGHVSQKLKDVKKNGD